MSIRRLDHVQLAMPEGRESEAIDFYEGLLGIPLVPKAAHLAARGGCWFERDELKVHLGVDSHFRPATKAHPAFIFDDEPLDGYDRVYVDDPFGNRIELMEPLA